MVFTFVAARSTLAGFEWFNREVYALLHSIMPPKNEKKEGIKKRYKCNW
jgi:hypothetical protein